MASSQLDAATISGNFVQLPIERILSVVARQLNVELVVHRNLYYLGERRPEDLAVMVRRVMRLTAEEIQGVVLGFAAGGGTQTVTSDGLVIVGDRVEVLERLHEVFDRLEQAPSVLWAVQLHVVSMTDSDLHDFGFDVKPALELAVGYAELSNVTRSLVSGVMQGVRGEGGQSAVDMSLSAVLRAARERSSIRIVADPLFTMIDGETATMVKGSSIPVRDTVVNAQNGQSQSSVRFVQTGLDISATVREVSATMARLKLDLSIADVIGTSLEAPITDRQAVVTSADVRTGGVYLLGALRRSRDEKSQAAALTVGERKNQEGDVWLLFCKCYRVASSLE